MWLVSLLLVALVWSQEEIDMCLSALDNQNFGEAVYFGRIAVERYPAMATAHYCLGRAYHRLGDPEGALRHLREAERLTTRKENLIHIYNETALVLRSMGETERALSYLEEALAVAREVGERDLEASILTNLALMHQDAGRREKALEYYELAVEIGGEDPAVLINLGGLYREMGDLKKAEKKLREGISLARERGDRVWEANGYMYLGWVYADTGNLERAEELMIKAVRIFEELGLQERAGAVRKDLDRIRHSPSGQP